MGQGPGPKPGGDKPLMRLLGECVGHVWVAIKTPVEDPREKPESLVRQSTHEAEVMTPGGPVTVRRTVIDEVQRAE